METVIERKGLLGRGRWVLLDGALVSPEDVLDAKVLEMLNEQFREVRAARLAWESRRSLCRELTSA